MWNGLDYSRLLPCLNRIQINAQGRQPTQKLIQSYRPEQNRIVERSNKTPRWSTSTRYPNGLRSVRIRDLKDRWAPQQPEETFVSLQYFMPVQYHRWEPWVLLAVRDAKIENTKPLRREGNMKMKKGGEMARTVSQFFSLFVRKSAKHCRNTQRENPLFTWCSRKAQAPHCIRS